MREIELIPSRLLGLLLLGVTVLALAAIHLAAVPAAIGFALGVAVIGLGVLGWRRASPVARLRIVADGRLQCRDGAAEWRDAEVVGDTFVSAALIVLRYRTPGRGVRSLSLLPDSAGADDLRRLRVSLRWAPRTHSGTSYPDAG